MLLLPPTRSPNPCLGHKPGALHDTLQKVEGLSTFNTIIGVDILNVFWKTHVYLVRTAPARLWFKTCGMGLHISKLYRIQAIYGHIKST